MYSRDILIKEKEQKTYIVHAYHGNDVDNCGGEWICIEETSYTNVPLGNDQWGTKHDYVHECRKCGVRNNELTRRFPHIEYEEI